MNENNLDDYKENLKDYLDIIKQDLNIILTSTIPTQKNLMKTILWLNISILAIIMAIFSKHNMDNIIYLMLSIPFIFSFISIFLILKSLIDGRQKTFASPPLTAITDKLNNQFERIKGLLALISSITFAYEQNAKIVQQRADKIHKSINLTIVAGISMFFVIIVIANKVISY